MALTKDQKTAQLTELVEKLKDSESVMFSHYIGLNVGDVSELRSNLRKNNAEMKVAKKTLISLAFKEAGLPDVTPDDLEGPVACIFSFEDPLSGAQTAYKFAKDHDQVQLVGGVYDGKILSKEEANELAKMPGRDQLLGMFATMLRSPLVSFASLCSSPLGGFARALDQIAEKGLAGSGGSGGSESKKEEGAEVAEGAEEKTETETKPDEAPAESETTEAEDTSAPSEPSEPSAGEEEAQKSDA